MSQFRVYLRPFIADSIYADEEIDITDDVDINNIGNIQRKIENDEFDVGVFKYNQINISLDNTQGIYGEADGIDSVFRYKRSDSIVRITWDLNDVPPYCGVAECGDALLSEEVEVFEGLLSDKSFGSSINVQKVQFTLLGFESLFERSTFPFGELVGGEDIADLFLMALDLPVITSLLTIDDINIDPALNFVPDDLTRFENSTSKQVLDRLLFISNSVLYIEGRTVYIRSRAPSADFEKLFYGQASPNGPENIIDIDNISSGLNRLFNFWTWAETSLLADDDSSVNLNGTFKKEIDDDMVTDNAKRQDILDALLDEWRTPKQEFDLKTFLDYDTLALRFFDKVSIDYPAIYFPIEGEETALYDQAIYDQSIYPLTQWALVIDPVDEFKIMGFSINMKDQTLTLNIREV